MDGVLVTGSDLHKKLVWFVFASLLQKDLDEVVYEWNTHFIRKSRHDVVPGVPDVLFYLPEHIGYRDSKQEIDIQALNDLSAQNNIESEADEIQKGVDGLMLEYFNHVVESKHLSYPPASWEEGLYVYKEIAREM